MYILAQFNYVIDCKTAVHENVICPRILLFIIPTPPLALHHK